MYHCLAVLWRMGVQFTVSSRHGAVKLLKVETQHSPLTTRSYPSRRLNYGWYSLLVEGHLNVGAVNLLKVETRPSPHMQEVDMLVGRLDV